MAESEEAEKKKAQEMQQKFMEYQMAEQQLKQLQQQLEKLDEQKGEAAKVEESLKDFHNSKPGSEVMVPISGGIFFKAELKGNEKFLVNVGSGVVVEKDIEGVKALVQSQVGEIENYRNQMMTEFTRISLSYQALEKELKKMVEN